MRKKEAKISETTMKPKGFVSVATNCDDYFKCVRRE